MGIKGIVCRDCPTSFMIIFDSKDIPDRQVEHFFDQIHPEPHTEIRDLSRSEKELYNKLKESLRDRDRPNHRKHRERLSSMAGPIRH